MSTLSLRPLLEQAVEIAQRDPAGAGMAIAVHGPHLMLDGDAELIKALFLNLLLNSAQAMQGRGRIDVTVSEMSCGVRVAVRDYGPGIPEHLRTEIFEPFFTTKTRGGGLGLAIARRTAELHGGSLVLAQPEGGGTEMIVTLARRPLDAARLATEHGE